MAPRLRLTDIAHREICTIIEPGDRAIDATAGNGHDTLFLAGQVGRTGRVFAFDIQAAALEQTRRRLTAAGLTDRVTLIHMGHERLCTAIPEALHGRVAAVMFNLGYLPGSDRQRITRVETTLAALDQAVSCLRPGGILTLIAYPGHAGGAAETAAVRQWIRRTPAFATRTREINPRGDSAPVLFLAPVTDAG